MYIHIYRRFARVVQATTGALLATLSLALLGGSQLAQARPTEGGFWSFDPTDEVVYWEPPDSPFRVHYSVAGPNQTLLEDLDQSGVPDFVEQVGHTAELALSHYTQELGFRPPVTEAELYLGALGGSSAYDIYLVDFDGGADGLFDTDACDGQPTHCAGYLVVENDFTGYGYPSLTAAIETLVSHELFHAVQFAYHAQLPVWVSEGTAVWAQRQFDPGSTDFIRLCQAYLADPGRPLYRPPGGPVQRFAYGTALWWDFLSTRSGAEVIRHLLEATEMDPEAKDVPAQISALLTTQGDTLSAAWSEFARWNLATGSRSGAVVEAYDYAQALNLVEPEREDSSLDHDLRVYPLANAYFFVHHPGGPLYFGLEPPQPDIVFSLHPTQGQKLESPVDPALDRWVGDATPGPVAEGDPLPAGGYWLLASNPNLGSEPAKAKLCLGVYPVVDTCLDTGLDQSTESSTDTDGSDTQTDTDESGTQTDTDESDTQAGSIDDTGDGCTCTATPAPAPFSWGLTAMVGISLCARRRRRTSSVPISSRNVTADAHQAVSSVDP